MSDLPQRLQEILDKIRKRLDKKEKARGSALSVARELVRDSSVLIKHLHRDQWEQAKDTLRTIGEKVGELKGQLTSHPDLWQAGFVQDALKEVAEACLLFAIISSSPIPGPDEIGCDDASYLNGLAEAMNELRRVILDDLRRERLDRAETYLRLMDDVFYMLLAFDHADALTLGLRHRVDSLRAILERTRSDVTLALQYRRLGSAAEGTPPEN